jgi:hypothetical protein
MGCGCKTKKINGTTINADTGEEVKDEKPNKLRVIGGTILMCVVVTLLMPLVWVLLIISICKSSDGNGWDMTRFLANLVKKKEKPEVIDEEEINPDDYEVVGVDKID